MEESYAEEWHHPQLVSMNLSCKKHFGFGVLPLVAANAAYTD